MLPWTNSRASVPSAADEEAQKPKDETKRLMKALGLEGSLCQFSGWIRNSFPGNTNGTPKNRLNYSVFPNRRANDWQGNQYDFIIEKTARIVGCNVASTAESTHHFVSGSSET
jgi:hypothetical protein